MADDGGYGWDITERALADVVGLDPDAEWLLGHGMNGGEARGQFLSRKLTARYEDRFYPDKADTSERSDSTGPPPFSLLISPEPGSTDGERILAVLDEISRTDEAPAEGEDAPPEPLFVMTEAERENLANNGTAGAICNLSWFRTAVRHADFRRIGKVLRLSSAIRERAVPRDGAMGWLPEEWLEPAFGQAFQQSPKGGNGQPPVVVGVIDDSFAIGHPRFQFANGQSRIFSYWDQDADLDPEHGFVPFGRELLSFNPGELVGNAPDLPGLDAFLSDARSTSRPGPEFYTLPQLRPFYPPRPNEAQRLASHGTHVLDLVAGAPPSNIPGQPTEQPADEAPALLLVKLPRSSVQDTSGAHLEFFLLQGVRHIIARARMLDPQAKVVIVSSYGFYGGPHDGASQLERALDAEIGTAGDIEIVLPSGNGRRARSHTRRGFEDTAEQQVRWRLPPDDGTPSVMEVWSGPYDTDGGDDGVGDRLELSLVTPDGRDSAEGGFVLTDTDITKKLVLIRNGEVVAQAVCVHPSMHPGRRLFLVWMQSTALAGPDARPNTATSGVWTVRLRRVTGEETTPASVWIRRDDSLVGFASGGRQSGIERDVADLWKDDPNYPQDERERIGDEGTAQRSSTISKIAAGGRTVIVGGFDVNHADNFPSPDSAGGPTAPNPDTSLPPREGPDALAPSSIYDGLGLAAAGFFGGGTVRFGGTSVAAPLVAAELAAAITDAGYPGGRDYVQLQAVASEAGLPTRAQPSPALGGAGRYLTQRMKDRGMRFEGT